MVEIQLKLDAEDLQASLKSDLLQSGLDDLWQKILAARDSKDLAVLEVRWQKIAIANQKLNLTGNYQDSSGKNSSASFVYSEFDLANEHTLYLSPLNISSDLLNSDLNSQLEIDLGTDVNIEKLTIESEQIVCAGNIRVNN